MTLLESDPNVNERFLAQHFYNNLHSSPLALKHMSAYLEKFGYDAANRVHRELSRFQKYNQLLYDKRDILQMAWLFASTPDKFFKNFNPQHPLENYACKTMEYKIKQEIFRIQMGQKQFSDWGLLKHCTRKSLQQALQCQGCTQPQLGCYLLAYNCFKEIYAPQRATSNRSLQPPTDTQFQEITNLYNHLVQQSALATLDTVHQQKIKQWLLECIQALRNFRSRQIISLDAPKGEDENSLPLSQITPDPTSESLWEKIIVQELTPQMMTTLSELLTQLDRYTNNHLLLKYGFNLDYRSIAPFFFVDSTTISRHCNKTTQKLLGQLTQWAQEELHITPDSENLKEINTLLKQCLNQYYQDFIFRSVFQDAWQQLDSECRHILYLRYFRRIDEAAIAHNLQLSELEVTNGLVTGTQKLAAAVCHWISNHLTVSLDFVNPLADKIAIFVQTLIANYPEHEF
ncbi:hypothetical protein [Brasilonema bromeliae]|uniref:Sigma-70 family RNA polymerase sigma factor n=1 Tax=Brasilonema bromeliae SPC951 TaxID=385972 RepID=A0ABX1P873_9CYAN|nr:hypothetical protein [Brasilonema bromeliae]NMG19861.1 hypothetical protein [Brasilonema bromeliae SPC951]